MPCGRPATLAQPQGHRRNSSSLVQARLSLLWPRYVSIDLERAVVHAQQPPQHMSHLLCVLQMYAVRLSALTGVCRELCSAQPPHSSPSWSPSSAAHRAWMLCWQHSSRMLSRTQQQAASWRPGLWPRPAASRRSWRCPACQPCRSTTRQHARCRCSYACTSTLAAEQRCGA
jgi:hypothetical protein